MNTPRILSSGCPFLSVFIFGIFLHLRPSTWQDTAVCSRGCRNCPTAIRWSGRRTGKRWYKRWWQCNRCNTTQTPSPQRNPLLQEIKQKKPVRIWVPWYIQLKVKGSCDFLLSLKNRLLPGDNIIALHLWRKERLPTHTMAPVIRTVREPIPGNKVAFQPRTTSWNMELEKHLQEQGTKRSFKILPNKLDNELWVISNRTSGSHAPLQRLHVLGKEAPHAFCWTRYPKAWSQQSLWFQRILDKVDSQPSVESCQETETLVPQKKGRGVVGIASHLHHSCSRDTEIARHCRVRHSSRCTTARHRACRSSFRVPDSRHPPSVSHHPFHSQLQVLSGSSLCSEGNAEFAKWHLEEEMCSHFANK